MSEYKNPFEPGGKFYNPRITDASRVTEPRIMPRWAEERQEERQEEQEHKTKTKFYDKDSGMLLEEFDDSPNICYAIDKNEYNELKEKRNNSYAGKLVPLLIFITINSKTIRELILSKAEANVRAFLTTIRQTERGRSVLTPLPYNSYNGTTNGKLNLFTEKTYAEAPLDYAEHPGKYKNPKNTAAGAYQFLLKTWNNYKDSYVGLDDFSPFSQDKAAVCMLYDNHVLDRVKIGSPEEIKKVKQILSDKKQWTSFDAFSDDEMQKLFNKNKMLEDNYLSIIYTPFDFGLLEVKRKNG